MSYNLFIDDLRTPPQDREWVVVRSSAEALAVISERGFPSFISFDHDLGGEDTSMAFLQRLVNEAWNGEDPPPDYQIHSANPVGAQNILAFMESWKRSREI